MKYTNQTAFDKAAPALIRQRQFSRKEYRGDDVCLYRSPDGCKCAIGHLIPDEKYNPAMECKPIASIFSKMDLKELFENCDLEFLKDLQLAHDGALNPSEFESRLLEAAKNHGLNTNCIDAL